MKRFRSSPPPPPPSPWTPGFDVATALHAFAHSFAGAFALITTAALCFVALLHYRDQRLNIPLSKQRLRSLIAIADAGMAGTFLVLGIEMLQGLEAALHRLFDADVQLFNPRMLASMAIFSINATPPTPRAFSICTLSAFFAGGALHALGYVGHEAEIYAVGLHVMLSKLSASNFAPCIGLAAYAAQKPWATGEPFYFLLSPWISGHVVLYLFALAAAVPRRAIRVWLARHEWSVLQRKQVFCAQNMIKFIAVVHYHDLKVVRIAFVSSEYRSTGDRLLRAHSPSTIAWRGSSNAVR